MIKLLLIILALLVFWNFNNSQSGQKQYITDMFPSFSIPKKEEKFESQKTIGSKFIDSISNKGKEFKESEKPSQMDVAKDKYNSLKEKAKLTYEAYKLKNTLKGKENE